MVIFPPWLHFFSLFFSPKWFVLLPRLEGVVSDLSPGALPWQAGKVTVTEGRRENALVGDPLKAAAVRLVFMSIGTLKTTDYNNNES